MRIFKRRSYYALAMICLVVVTAVAGTLPAAAQLDQDKLSIIKTNCLQAQVTIQQIQYNDAATRVNRGQAYESLLADFINPLNSRAAANGYNNDAASLASTATRYQKALTKFKNDYESYDDTISAVLKTKCRDKADTFYDNLEKARFERSVVGTDVTALGQIIDEYQTAAQKLAKEVQ